MAPHAPYAPEDLARLKELAPHPLTHPAQIGAIIDAFGYQADWKDDYQIQSVHSSLHSPKITCIDAAVLSYGLLEYFFPNTKRRLLAIHRRDMHGEECGHCITLYWTQEKGPPQIGAFSKSSFLGFNHREPIYESEESIAQSFAQAYLKMGFTPLYYGVMTLEEAGEGLDWRHAEAPINLLSERLIERYQYAFDLAP